LMGKILLITSGVIGRILHSYITYIKLIGY